MSDSEDAEESSMGGYHRTSDGWVRTDQLGEYLKAKAMLDMVAHR